LNAIKKFTIDLSEEDKIRQLANEWVMLWVKTHHPEVFDTARQFAKDHLDEEDEN
jgi:hypothetical protein